MRGVAVPERVDVGTLVDTALLHGAHKALWRLVPEM
jgi:hypothetical protein